MLKSLVHAVCVHAVCVHAAKEVAGAIADVQNVVVRRLQEWEERTAPERRGGMRRTTCGGARVREQSSGRLGDASEKMHRKGVWRRRRSGKKRRR